jgi:hypothetical protein
LNPQLEWTFVLDKEAQRVLKQLLVAEIRPTRRDTNDPQRY